MTNALKLAAGWTGTATIATAATVALLHGGTGGTGGTLSQAEVGQRLAAGQAAPTPGPADQVVGVLKEREALREAMKAATKVVTPRGTVTIGCKPGKSRVALVIARTPRAGSQTDPWWTGNQADWMMAQHDIPDTKFTAFWPVAGPSMKLAPPDPRTFVMLKPATLVFSWCEGGKPKWRVVNQ